MVEQFKKMVINNFWLLLLLILPFIASLFYAFIMPVSLDEAATFLLFTNKGFFETASLYPAPNNHIFHSILTNFTKHIPYLSVLLQLRISSIIVYFLSLLVLYKFVATHFSIKTALIVIAISSMLFLNIYYSYMSRGHALINLFFISSLFCAFNIIKEKNTIRNWQLFSVFSIFGFYTMPSYLYPFISLNCFIFIFQLKNSKQQLISNMVILILFFLLYLPIIYIDGLHSIISNTFVKRMGFGYTIKTLPFFYIDTIREITGIHWGIVISIVIISLYYILKSKNTIHLYFSIVFIVAPLLLLSIHSVIPFSRVFNYYGFIIVLLIIMPFTDKIEKVHLKFLIPVLLVIQGFLVMNFDTKIDAFEDKDQAINSTCAKIIPRIIGNKKYLFNNSLLVYNLEFQLISKGYKEYQIKVVDYKKINADSISKFDYIIIKKEEDKTKNKKTFITTDYYNIYEN